MDRVTKSDLRAYVGFLNDRVKDLGFDNVTFDLDVAYGGYRLVQMCESGGERDISYRLTARELYYVLTASEKILSELAYEKRHKENENGKEN